jgi:hypothetical protein
LRPSRAGSSRTRRPAALYEALGPYAAQNATTPPELCLGSVARSLGILAATVADWDASVRHFEDALQTNAAMGARPWLAHTQYDDARMLTARGWAGDPGHAGTLLAAAGALAGELGMRALSADVAAARGRG